MIQQELAPPVGTFGPKAFEILKESGKGNWDNRLPPSPDAKVILEATIYKKDVIFRVKTGAMFGTAIDRSKMASVSAQEAEEAVSAGATREAESLPVPKQSRRGRQITRYSYQSARRLRLLVRNTSEMWKGFLTLTYPGSSFPTDGRIVKRHIHAFGQWLRRNNVPYVWVIEFQERGAPHFHMLVAGWVNRDLLEWNGKQYTRDKIPRDAVGVKILREGLETRWNEIVGGDEDHLWCGTQIKAAKNSDKVGEYMGAYISKIDQKGVPNEYKNVGRFWGSSRCLTRIVVQMDIAYKDAVEKLSPFLEENIKIRQGWAKNGFETYAQKWEWKGYGFTLISGADFFCQVMRQAFEIDAGRYPWKSPESVAAPENKFIKVNDPDSDTLDDPWRGAFGVA